MISLQRTASLLPTLVRASCLASLASLAIGCGDDVKEGDSVGDTSSGTAEGTTDDEVGETLTSSSESATDTMDGSTTDAESTTTMDGSTTTDGGGGVCEGACGTPGCGACPDAGTVAIPGNFTIGATEVRNSEYEAFLDVGFTPEFLAGWLPAECGWKSDFTPDGWDANEVADLPVTGVDWCDAWAYCEWSGQHMCGRIGGGAAALNEVQNPQLNEWFKACSQGGIKNYPYALMYNANACNGLDAGYGELTEVGSLQTCVGGYPGIFDMSGNAWEWENSCDTNPNVAVEDQECHQRGGSFYSNGPTLRCGIDSSRPRNYRNDNLGIRCCDTP